MARCVRDLLLIGVLVLAGCDGSGQIAVGDDDDDTSDDDTWDDIQVDDVSYRLHDEIESLVYVTWTQEIPALASVEYRIDAEQWRSTPPRHLEAGDREMLVLGVPYESSFAYRVVNDHGDEVLRSLEQLGQTGPLPGGLPLPAVLASQSEAWDPADRYLIGSINQRTGGWTGGDYWKFIIDRQGRVLWASLTPDQAWTIYVRVSYDGDDLLWDEFTYWNWDMGESSKVVRAKIDGTVVETISTPGGHHAFTELDDETIVWGAATWETETLEKRTPDGTQTRIWDCEDYHDEYGIDEFCQSNSLYWHEPTDTFLYSFYSTSSVVEVDHTTGANLRVWGQVPTPWAFDPADAGCYWQHGVTYTDSGTVLWSTHRSPESSEAVAREYEVDEDDQVLREIWNFGLDEFVFAYTAGEAHRLANGNTLHNYGSGAQLREVTPEKELVWDVKWPGDRLLGRTVFLEDLYVFAP